MHNLLNIPQVSLVSGIDRQDYLLFGDGEKNIKIDSAENMVLGHCLVDGEETWPCNSTGNWLAILVPVYSLISIREKRYG